MIVELDWFQRYYCPPDFERAAFGRWLGQHAAIFFDPAVWFAQMREFDFLIGTRIHGSVAAIQGGCPALTLVHDSRTQELCEYFHLPFIKLTDFNASRSPQYYAEMCDFQNFQATYAARLSNYVDFLNENELLSPLLEAAGSADAHSRQAVPDLTSRPVGEATTIRNLLNLMEDARTKPKLSRTTSGRGANC